MILPEELGLRFCSSLRQTEQFGQFSFEADFHLVRKNISKIWIKVYEKYVRDLVKLKSSDREKKHL